MSNVTEQQKINLTRANEAFVNQDIRTAELAYRKLISENISSSTPYTQLALICARSNRIGEAKTLWTDALALSPGCIDALLGLGDIAKYERNFLQAASYYKKVIVENPNHALAYLSLSYCLQQAGKLDDSEKACRQAISIAPHYSQAKEFLGQVLIAKGEYSKAKEWLNQLIINEPTNIRALYTFGNLLKSQGDFKQASKFYQKIWSIMPEYSQAHFTYSTIHKYKDINDPHLLLMQTQYQGTNNTEENKIQLSFALAKAFEDLNQYEEAFKYLEAGNSIRFKRYNYHISSDELFIKNIMQTFNSDAINQLKIKAENSRTPIFIVGMPRSGTSLVEKIIATHSQVHGAGELDHFFQLGMELINESSSFLFSPLAQYPPQVLENIGHTYLSKIHLLSSTSRHVTDKLPFNMLLIGLIKIVFPNAKIIHCTRDAKDNCLSIYKKNFTTDNYRFAYDLKALGQFYNLYAKLMEHWHTVFPGEIYDVQYESLIKNPEHEIKKLITACDLPWEKECLNFHQSEAIVTTASAYQVRQPIYSTSVKLWKKYEKFIAPLLKELNKVGSVKY
ncbi:tetratricopeptide repeat-containing sulfotransferase family protein [Thalassotalea piscium]